MEKLSLVALLDEDREMVMNSLTADRALASAQVTLEKAVERVMYRYVEGCGDEALRDSAQRILQATKNTLPVIDAVGEARAWKKQTEGARREGLNMGPLATLLLLAGAALILASVVGVLIGGRLSGLLPFIEALLPAALGCGALFWAGIQSARPPRKRGSAADAAVDVRTEYLVDVEKAWHCLRGAMVQADGQLERVREEEALRRERESNPAAAGELDPGALELLAELLESAYASGDESARESISAMRFYLHNAGVDVTDYGPGRDSWFEFLPAARPGTIRPALTSKGRLLKKGLASMKH